MKKLARFLSIALSVISLFTIAGCNNGNNGNNESSNTNNGTVTTNETLYRFGKSDYKIVIPENATTQEIFAAEELNLRFSESTDYKFEVIRDTNLSYSEDQKYLSIGNTKLLETCGVNFKQETLSKNGYKLQTVGNSVFFVGGNVVDATGSVNAVYKFLEDSIDYKYYAKDCVQYDRVYDLKLKNYSECEIPAFEYNTMGFKWTWGDKATGMRYRSNQNVDSEWWVWGHSEFALVSPSTYGAEHPDWFARDNGDPNQTWCYSSEGLKAQVIENVKSKIASTDYNIFQIAIMDTYSACRCKDCEENRVPEKYTNDGGLSYAFVCDVAEAVEPWVKENYPGRNIEYLIFAYHHTLGAPNPTKYIKPRDDVGVMFAPIDMDFSQALNDPTCGTNVSTLVHLQNWRNICGDKAKFYVWNYCTNFSNYLTFFPNFNSIAETYKTYLEYGVTYLFDQGSYSTKTTNFDELRLWLHCKLAWDPWQDVNALIDEFMRAYYGVAYEEMMSYFRKTVAWFEDLADQMPNEKLGYVYHKIEREMFWPKGILDSFEAEFVKAFEDIDALRAIDPQAAQEYYDRVSILRVSVVNLQLLNYASSYSRDEYLALIDWISNAFAKYDIKSAWEGGSIGDRIKEYESKV